MALAYALRSLFYGVDTDNVPLRLVMQAIAIPKENFNQVRRIFNERGVNLRFEPIGNNQLPPLPPYIRRGFLKDMTDSDSQLYEKVDPVNPNTYLGYSDGRDMVSRISSRGSECDYEKKNKVKLIRRLLFIVEKDQVLKAEAMLIMAGALAWIYDIPWPIAGQPRGIINIEFRQLFTHQQDIEDFRNFFANIFNTLIFFD